MQLNEAPPSTIDYDRGTATPTRVLWGFRWWICALLFFATTINYVDRSVIGYLKGHMQQDLGWTEIDYGNVVAAFSLAYAFGYLLSGRFMDLVGVRVGYSLAVGVWSLAVAAHALARTVFGFQAARFGLGLAEGGNFPAAVKTVSEWFPKKERALATGIFNAGSNIGAIVTPFVVTFITMHYGWRDCFLFTGALGALWLVAWLLTYRHPDRHPAVTPQELAHIRADPPDPTVRISWLGMLRYRQTWAYVAGFAISSPVWWFYLYWLPDFLKKSHNLNDQQIRWPIVVVYLISDFGSIAGGWFSSALIHRGYSINFARKVALLACAVCVVPVFFAPRVAGMWEATLLIALAAAAHQGFSANLFTLASDTMPRYAVSSLVGIGGFTGGLMGMAFQVFAGHLLQWNKSASYVILFGICSCAYLVALAIIHALLPRLEPAHVEAADVGFPVIMPDDRSNP